MTTGFLDGKTHSGLQRFAGKIAVIFPKKAVLLLDK
jgi:hypothetical protein